MAHDLYRVTPQGAARFVLHPGQARAWRSNARFTFIIAGTQGGKTSFLPLWLKREIDRAEHGDFLAATATYDLFKLKFLPEMRRFFVDGLGWQEDKSDRIFWRQYKPKFFDRIILRSASSEGGLESATVKGAVLDECGQDDFRLESWEAVQRRLSLNLGRVLGATTPYNLGWLKHEVFDRWIAKDPLYRVVQFKSIQNPAFPVEEYERVKASMPRWKFEMFYNGEFSRPAGLIYEDFDEAIHRVSPFLIPPQWPRYLGIDFGAVHTAVVWIAENPRTKAHYLYREYLEGGRTTPEHVKAVKAASQGENVVRVIGGAKSETQQRMDWNAAGLPVRETQIVDVEAGIDRVIGLFKDKTLFVFDTCRGVMDELGTYARVLDDSGQPTEKIKGKETFHRLDALRYAVSGIAAGDFILFGA